MSPFSPMLGCLPMLLPMPILYALYYVLQNTIELRGVPFLWLPDLSLRDPYYITPIVMGVSMFLLSWIGMRAAPPNPQAKMMSYMMPVMFTVMFLNFASGLNLYYAVQNIAALPQQLHGDARARQGAGVSTPSASGRPRGRIVRGARIALARLGKTTACTRLRRHEDHLHRPRDAAARDRRRAASHRSELRPEARTDCFRASRRRGSRWTSFRRSTRCC